MHIGLQETDPKIDQALAERLSAQPNEFLKDDIHWGGLNFNWQFHAGGIRIRRKREPSEDERQAYELRKKREERMGLRIASAIFLPLRCPARALYIYTLVAPILADDADMVTGFKEGKYEKAFVSGIYNRLSRTLFNVPVRDLNSVKAYRREVMDVLPVRPDWHRYMVVLAAAQGFHVTEIPVPLFPRHAGKSKFATWHRIPVGVLDMLAVWFELRFGQKPLLLFGMLGAALFAVGALTGVVALIFIRVLGVRWLWTLVQTCLILGSVFFATGLLGEQIAGQRAEARELRRRVDELHELHDLKEARLER